MAVDGEKVRENRGRRRGFQRKKLLVNEKVEVRSVEDGFMGSWHPGTVIRSGRKRRHVRYDNLLDDNGVHYLEEVVRVSNVLDGIPSSSDSCYQRGFIRPVPPPVQFDERELQFGLCVDVYHEEAWWEGVVFDYSNGSKERSVFFPDLGDEIRVQIDQLRITQDWDEAITSWEPRGKWVMLELYEECHWKSYIPISIKQIWYDVRTREDFNSIGEWTRNVKDLWREPVMEVIDDYYILTLKELQPLLNLPEDFSKETTSEPESLSEPADNNVDGGACQSNVLGEGSDIGTSQRPDENGDSSNSNLLGTDDQICSANSLEDDAIDKEIPQPVENVAPLHEISPESLKEMSIYDADETTSGANIGEQIQEISPESQNEMSIYDAGEAISGANIGEQVQEISPESQNEMSIYDAGEAISGANIGEQFQEISPEHQKEMSIHDAGEAVSGANTSKQRKKRRPQDSIVWRPLIFSELEFCPDLINQYAIGSKSRKTREGLKTKVRKHLAYLGWTIEWTENQPFTNRKRYRYKSPEADDKKVYTSLIEVIKYKHNQLNSVLLEVDPNSVPSASASASAAADNNVLNLLSDQSNANQELDVHPQTSEPCHLEIKVETDFCPEAVVKYYLNALEKNRDGKREWKLKAQSHLLAEGWVIQDPTEMRRTTLYFFPKNKFLGTLQGACRMYLKEKIPEWTNSDRASSGVSADQVDTNNLLLSVSQLLEREPQLHTIDVSLASISPEKSTKNKKRKSTKSSRESTPKRQRDDELPTQASSPKSQRNDESPTQVLRSKESTPKRQWNDELPTQASSPNSQRNDESPTQVLRSKESTPKHKRNDELPAQASSPNSQRNDESPTQVLRSSKRVQEVVSPSVAQQKPQNILSWLIENNKVFPRYKVHCYSGKGGRTSIVTEGRITREGIKCSCCQKLYSLGGFVNHANGSSDRRPCASIYLKDGRSLLECMVEVMHEHRVGETMDKPTNYLFQGENDNICTVCNYGGELILCDRCPSSFHKNCLGLEDIPDGDWFCPSCRCGSCGQINIEETGDEQLLTCVQCEHKYHVRCLRNKSGDNLGSCQENWLCSQECQKIHAGLRNLLGKEILVGENGLTWTLMKFDNTENNSKAENYSKLNVALSVMHECFEPLENPFSARDLVEEVIFSRRSGLNRLNFQGFYTVLLERNDELISVATIRVFGEKVAEVPLVATRIQYRRLGMCSVLMDELEKKLKQLGVERLVLPAVPQVLQTWTDSFGFAEMTNSERSQFVDYAFLDFQGTTMCQKMLTRKPSPDSVVTRETPPKPGDVFSVKCRIDFDKSSPVSEVDQAEESHKSSYMALQVV